MKKQFLIYCILFATPVALFGARGGGEAASAATPTLTTPPGGGAVPTATLSASNFAGIADLIAKAQAKGALNDVFGGAADTLKYNAASVNKSSAWYQVGVSLAGGTAVTAIAVPTGAAQSSKRSLGRLGNSRR